jgi:hypothetical protein
MRALLDDVHEFEIGEAVPLSFGREAEPTDIPDAELIRLGKRLTATWACERALAATDAINDPSNDELFDKLYAASETIVHSIADTPASSLEGLKVKASAISWCCSGDPFTIGGGDTVDVQLAVQIVNDLLKA